MVVSGEKILSGLRHNAGMTSSGIGASVLRREDERLLTGRGRYTDDLRAPDQAHAVFVRSPHAHADLGSIDTRRALTLPGVLGVFTGADLVSGMIGLIPTLIAERGGGKLRNRDGTGFAEPTWPVLAIGRVRHIGDPVAIVVAETLHQALDAAEAVDVAYTPRAHVIDGADALAQGAPQLHADVRGNRAYDWECGDPAATARAIDGAAHVVRLAVRHNRLVTCYLEPRAALAAWDPAWRAGRGRFTLHASLQSPHANALVLARILGVDPDQVRGASGDVGGGFGTKNHPYPEYAALLWAARRLGRPIKWTSTRSEAFVSDAQSRDVDADAELALDAQGRILALRVRGIANIGAYVAPCIPFSLVGNMQRMISSVYAIPAIHLHLTGALTNTVPINVYRGVGRLESVFTVERLIGVAAVQLGLDPAEIRQRNMVNAFPYTTPTGAVYDSGDYRARMAEAIELADAGGFAARRADAARSGRLRGLGIGPYLEGTGGFPTEYAEVRVHAGGTVEVPIGCHSQGQGHETTLAQVVAERLQVPFDSVRIITGDTDLVAQGTGTFASRTMVKAGGAAAEVVDLVIVEGRRMAAHLMEAAVGDLEYRDGRFRVAGTDRSIGIFEVAQAAESGALPDGFARKLEQSKMHENARFAFANGCEVCEVEVDAETGVVEVVRLAIVDDSGRAVNPMVVHGQMHGAAAQGLGQALMEHTVYDRQSGQLVAGSFMDYAIPRADELPSMPVLSSDVPSPTNILGVKGAGEGPTVGTPGAVIHAILDALAPLGVTSIDMPATPERVWLAINAARQ